MFYSNNVMKRHLSLLAIGLCGISIAHAQTTTNTYSTTTNATYTSPVTTDSTNSTNSVPAASQSTGTSTNSGTMNSTAAPTTYGTTTTTTTSTDYNANATPNARPAKADRAWGKDGKFGIYAGVNGSRFVGELENNRTSTGRVGYQVGLYGRSGGTVFGQIGAEFRRSSSNLQQAGNGATVEALEDQIDQTFLAIPAYVGLRVGSALGLRIQAGAELSSLVAIGDNNFSLGKDDLNRTILAGLLGVGINLGPLTVDAVYNRGLQNVFDNADTKRRILALNLGLRF